MNIEIKKQLAVLELGDLVSAIENQEKDVSLINLNYNDRLEHLLTELITERQNRLIARLTKNAELKYPNANLETLDCEARGINKDMIVNLASMGFVSECLICWVIFKITKIISESRYDTEKGLETTRF